MILGQLEIQMAADLARLRSDMEQAKKHVGDAMEYVNGYAEKAKQALNAFPMGAFYKSKKGRHHD